MPRIEIQERFKSGAPEEGDRYSDSRLFVLRGSDDRDALMSALRTSSKVPTSVTASDGTVLARKRVRLDSQEGPLLWYGSAEYESTDEERETGEEAFEFDTTGGSVHVTQAKAHVSSYAPAGVTAPNHKGAIGVTEDDVEGTDVVVPVFSFNATRYVAAEDMTQAYVAALYSLTGRTNNGSYTVTVDGVPLEFAEGELLFKGARGSKRGRGDWEVSLAFDASPNATGLAVGDITGVAKKGHEYLWVEYAKRYDATAKRIVEEPVAVHVERVYDPGAFASLQLGA